MGVPILQAAASPLLAWRDPVYITAGLAGIIGLCLLLLQPLLAGRLLPGISARQSRRLHHLVGFGVVLAVLAHVAGLWVTSPPDVIDALLFASPTPFAPWGVIGMWAVLAIALTASFRRRWLLSKGRWTNCHTMLAAVVVLGSVVHTMLVDGTMLIASKTILCLMVVVASMHILVKSWWR